MRFEVGKTVLTHCVYYKGRRYYIPGGVTGVIRKVYIDTIHIYGEFHVNGETLLRVTVRKGDARVVEPDNIIKLK